MQSHAKMRPLSQESKALYVQALAKTNPTTLNEVVTRAALHPQSFDFPNPLKQKLGTLQLALKQNANLPSLQPLLTAAITEYMKVEGCPLFRELITKPIKEDEWSSDLLHHLAGELKIVMNTPPVVQATIKHGKIYWRILQGNNVIYDRHQGRNEGIVFTEENSWLTDWRLFREFKDSGKRFSPVRITKAAFLATFPDPAWHGFAGAVWDELKQIGILNAKNRISHGWRALFNHDVKLNVIERQKFTSVKQGKQRRTELYNLVIANLESAANNPNLAETLPAIPGARLFRQERTHKSWAGTGKVSYATPEGESHCTKLWDVSVYEELTQHRSSADEKKNHGEILNYDHIPSSSALKSNPSSPVKIATDAKIRELETRLAEVIAARPKNTGHDLRDTPAEVLESFKMEKALLAQINAIRKNFHDEAEKWAYTIAIPKKLHQVGDTFMEAATTQQAFKGNVVLRDVSTHLKNIEENPEKYALKHPNDYLKAMGALRYLYHAECKPPTAIVGKTILLGRLGQSFFQPEKVKSDLDKMFIEKMQAHMKKR